MATKTLTRTKNIFTSDQSTDKQFAKAIFELDVDPSRPGVTRITLPEKSSWTPGFHWHEDHVEFFKVIQGRVTVHRDGTETTVGPEDGPVQIDKFVIHSFWRADAQRPLDQKDDGEVVTEEWTDPADGSKAIFFRNIFSTMEDGQRYWGWWKYPQALYIAANCDNFVHIVPAGRRVSYFATHLLYVVVNLFGLFKGLRIWYNEYTPESLRPY